MARILLIDDEPQIVTMLTTFLEREGHAIVSAGDGKEGLKILADSCFDIVITDILMPERDGFEVLMSIKKMPNRPKVIAITGGSSSLVQEYLLDVSEKMKADVVIPKPLQLQKLSKIINDLLSGSKTRI
jgi:CheY-like chemotaxis protein